MRSLLALLFFAAVSSAQGLVMQKPRPRRWVKDPVLQERIHVAIRKGVHHLLDVQNKDGGWTYDGASSDGGPNAPAGMDRFNDLGKRRRRSSHKLVGPADAGYTALALYALASSGINRRQDEVVRALEWMRKHDSQFDHSSDFGVYALSLRLLALARMDAGHFGPEIRAYADVLALSQSTNGMWGYRLRRKAGKTAFPVPSKSSGGGNLDNSNTQLAVLALWAAHSLAAWEAPKPFWKRLVNHYETSATRYGWGYRPGSRPTSTMTAAGLACSVYARAALDGSPAALQRARNSPTIKRGFEAFRAQLKQTNWKHYYLVYSIERVGTVLARRDLSWYETGAAHLCRDQHKRGSWGARPGMHGIYGTSLALLFLNRATFPPRKGAATPEDRVDVLSPAERVPELKSAKTHTRAFEIFLALSARERAAQRETLHARGDEMFEHLLGVMAEDGRTEARVTAAVLIRRWLGKPMLYDPNANADERRAMTRAIRATWKRAG
jgi:hypothetical protein